MSNPGISGVAPHSTAAIVSARLRQDHPTASYDESRPSGDQIVFGNKPGGLTSDYSTDWVPGSQPGLSAKEAAAHIRASTLPPGAIGAIAGSVVGSIAFSIHSSAAFNAGKTLSKFAMPGYIASGVALGIAAGIGLHVHTQKPANQRATVNVAPGQLPQFLNEHPELASSLAKGFGIDATRSQVSVADQIMKTFDRNGDDVIDRATESTAEADVPVDDHGGTKHVTIDGSVPLVAERITSDGALDYSDTNWDGRITRAELEQGVSYRANIIDEHITVPASDGRLGSTTYVLKGALDEQEYQGLANDFTSTDSDQRVVGTPAIPGNAQVGTSSR